MRKRILLLVVMALLALALFAPAAIAQDDDDDDDDRGAAAAGGALPRTGGPAFIAPVAGALLLGSGVIVGVVGLRRRSS